MLNRFGFRTLLMLMLLVLSLGLMAAGCGGDDDDDSGDSGDTVEMTTEAPADEADAEEPADAAPQVIEVPVVEGNALEYAVTEVRAAPGTITLTSVNPQSIPHNIAIDEPVQEIGEIVQDGGTSEITITIDEPGEYEYYCSVPGHREAGMVGTLIVE